MKKSLCFLPALLLLLSTTWAQPWVARHNLSSAQYQAEFNTWTGQGYRLSQVSGYSDNGQDRYAAIFEKEAGPAWVAKHGLTGAQYQAEFNTLTGQGYRPVIVSGFPSGNQAKYACIFIKENNAPQWVSKHGMTGAQYQTEFDKWVGQGYQLADVSGYTVSGTAYFAAIWEKKAGAPQWKAKHGLTSAQYQTEFNDMNSQGYRLYKVSGYSSGNSARFAAIWRKTGGPAFQARHGIVGSQNYQDEFDRLYYQGYRPIWVNGSTVNNGDNYAGIWTCADPFKSNDMQAVDNLVSAYMQSNNVPGLSFAISRNGKLVLAKTYGKADQEGNEKVAPRHRFRVASVSKPITAATIMSLIQQNKLNLSDKVFGPGALLGTTYGTKPYSNNMKNITVEHLLTHTCGGWGNSSNDPMFQDKTWSMSTLITKTLDDIPLANAPGTNYDYSNFGYCLLGRIIEKKMGKPYEDYVQKNILNQCDVTRMEIGGNTLAERKSSEVKYYAPGNPYGMNVTRMDAHGGWIATPIDLVRFLNRVDRFNTVPDFLSTASIDEMIQTTPQNNGYAKGWSVNASNNYWHNGALPGTIGLMVRTNDGFCWSILINTRPDNDKFAGKLDKLMWDIRGAITDWPAHNLF
ncbi:MAG: serine hydrolase [Lewinellaceae bacterium]|nr:serine hydrolase [Lewinellaceae bacterium]